MWCTYSKRFQRVNMSREWTKVFDEAYILLCLYSLQKDDNTTSMEHFAIRRLRRFRSAHMRHQMIINSLNVIILLLLYKIWHFLSFKFRVYGYYDYSVKTYIFLASPTAKRRQYFCKHFATLSSTLRHEGPWMCSKESDLGNAMIRWHKIWTYLTIYVLSYKFLLYIRHNISFLFSN